MLALSDQQAHVGALHVPATPEGHRLLELVTPHLPAIAAGAREHDRSGTLAVETFTAFGASGVLAATVPAELGGLGVTVLHDVALVLSRVAEHDASTALALHMQCSRGLTLTYEWRHGAPRARALAERLLRAIVDDGAIICGAIKDASTAHPTTLRRASDGRWTLSGGKTLVTMAPIATHFVVMSRKCADGAPLEIAAPVVRRDTPGLSVQEDWDGLGMRASGTVDIGFDDCPIADDDIFPRGPADTRGDGELAGQTVSSIAMMGIYVGVAQAARDVAVATLRKRGTTPPGLFGLLADTEAKLFTIRATAGSALMIVDALSGDLAGDLDERGRRMMATYQCAKFSVNQLAGDVVNACVAAVGGASYSARHPLARMYRDVRAGVFMQPYTYIDAVDYLGSTALGIAPTVSYR